MKTVFLRTLLTFASLLILTSFATAQQRGISNAFGLLPDDEATSPADFGVQEPEYAAETLAMEEQLAEVGLTTCGYDDGPNDDDQGDDEDCCDEGCTCDSCNGGGCGDSCSCVGSCSCGGGCCSDGCACGMCGDGCCDACGHDCYGSGCGNYCGDCSNYDMNAGMYYAEIQNLFLRTHVSSEVTGKLREKYEWSPRVVMGYESANGLGARMRWWSYSRTNSTVSGSDSFHIDLDVLDAEGTARFSSKRADLVIAGGFRYANFEIAEDDDEIAADLPGITFAADGRMAICCVGRSQWSAVCGARWSLLGGDWEGDDVDLLDDAPVFDDNVTTQEVYGGVEYLCHYCNYDLYARLVFEMQNWHSDAVGENSQTDSIGFVGPAIHGGVSF
jgi:hypothetical protein